MGQRALHQTSRKELAALALKPGRAKALRRQLRMLEKQALILSSFAMQATTLT
jgi:hypothetical protein